MVGLALVAGFYFSGLGFCLNHGYFCEGIGQYSVCDDNGRCQYHLRSCSLDQTDSHHPEDRRHLHRKGDPALAGRQAKVQERAPAPRTVGVKVQLAALSIGFRERRFIGFPASTLFSIRTVVILA